MSGWSPTRDEAIVGERGKERGKNKTKQKNEDKNNTDWTIWKVVKWGSSRHRTRSLQRSEAALREPLRHFYSDKLRPRDKWRRTYCTSCAVRPASPPARAARFRGRVAPLIEDWTRISSSSSSSIKHSKHKSIKSGRGLTAGGWRCPGDREVARVHAAGSLLLEERK